MIRKQFTVALIVSLALLLFTACSGGTVNAFGLVIDGTEYACGAPVDPLLSTFGDGYEYAEGLNCAYDSVDKTFTYPTVTIYTVPLEEGDIVSEIYTENPAVTSTEGIAVGASRADVVTAHGDGFEDLGNLLVYRSSAEGALCFEMENDAVVAIFVTTEAI
jgi:hypothetical protein